MRIVELNRNQKDHQNNRITVTGIVRATYASPFSHFLLEDESATLIIRPKGPLPSIKQHLKITGRFVLKTPANCTVELAMVERPIVNFSLTRQTPVTLLAAPLQDKQQPKTFHFFWIITEAKCW